MLLWLATFAFGFASAMIPFLPIEVYIIGAGAAKGGTSQAIALGVAAGAGATVGKMIWYELARRGSSSEWAQKKLASPKVKASYDKWVGRMQGRPAYAGTIMFVSAFVGIPPLLAMAAVGGFLRMRMWVFLPTVLVGRCLRFSLLFLGVDFAIH